MLKRFPLQLCEAGSFGILNLDVTDRGPATLITEFRGYYNNLTAFRVSFHFAWLRLY